MTYLPDTRTRLQDATRFFARLLAFDLECPHCGQVYQIRPRWRRSKVARRDAIPPWDPTTGRFTCGECQRVYVLGILAWPIVASPRVASATPEDQIPDPRQLAQMRKEGGGWWLGEAEGIRTHRPQETNLTTEEDRPEEE